MVQGSSHRLGRQEGLHHEESPVHLRDLGFYCVCDLEPLKDFKERIEFPFGKPSVTACWEMDWREEMVEASLSSSQVQKCLQWPWC